jgi:beta-lactamase superfamily II metal-dependent hydrolase
MGILKLHVLDVGQGASAILDFGNNQYGIIDCGGSKGGNDAPIVEFFRKSIRTVPSTRIIFLLISHLDLDHVRAIGALMADPDIEKRVERLYCNTLEYRALLDAIKDRTLKPKSGVAASVEKQRTFSALRYLGELVLRRLNNELDFHFECISPEPSDPARYPVPLVFSPSIGSAQLWAPSQRLRDLGLKNIRRPAASLLRAILSGHEVEDWNTSSIVITFEIGGRRVLLAGDATYKTWQEILDRAGSSWEGADIVVAWHHGAKLGSHNEIDYDALVWERVLRRDGRIVCISCGSHNNYGHPDPYTVEMIRRHSGEVFCTERAGKRVDIVDDRDEDATTIYLLGVAKSELWTEDERTCCGNILIEIQDTGSIKVSCSNGECGDRNSRRGCCTNIHGQLVNPSTSSPRTDAD